MPRYNSIYSKEENGMDWTCSKNGSGHLRKYLRVHVANVTVEK